MPPGETPNRVEQNALRAKAEKEHAAGLRTLKKESLGENERNYRAALHLTQWALLMAKVEPDNAIRWSGEASEWHKRACVAQDALANDKLDRIWAAVAQHRKDASALMSLVQEANGDV